jgi:RNA polymerase sigma-70 factor (ECF subfamily)
MLMEPPVPAKYPGMGGQPMADELMLETGEDSWGTLTTQLRPRLTAAVNSVLRTILKRSENPGYAEDIVNEAFTTAYEKRESYDPRRGRLYPWLLQIARNRTFDFLRRHRELKSERSFDENFDAPSGLQGPELLYENAAAPNAKTLALRRALKRLRQYDQELLICRFGNALDYEELERYFDFTVKRGTLRVHVQRAQTRLRRELAKEPAFREMLGHG